MIKFADVWSKLQCYTGKHLFRPSREEEKRYFLREVYRSNRGSRVGSATYVRYTCDCCDYETPWMDEKMHKLFIRAYCPTWGERGTDSQGYRERGEA